jgi:hypothetical protein
MGIADAGTDMMLHSAAPTTILITRGFMGQLLLLLHVRNKPANPELAWMVSRTPTGGRSRSVEDRDGKVPRPAKAEGMAGRDVPRRTEAGVS